MQPLEKQVLLLLYAITNIINIESVIYYDRPIEESLKLFEDMKKGKLNSSEATLRLKMDMSSPNPNMWDQVHF